MLVQQILSNKPSMAIETVPSSATIAEAVAKLSALRIGALVVSDKKDVVAGILSERDIVRELGKRGAECLSNKVSDLMTTRIVGCSRGDTNDEVLTKMTAGRFRHMPVLEDGKIIGLISIGDVVAARLSELAMEKDALQGMIMGR